MNFQVGTAAADQQQLGATRKSSEARKVNDQSLASDMASRTAPIASDAEAPSGGTSDAWSKVEDSGLHQHVEYYVLQQVAIKWTSISCELNKRFHSGARVRLGRHCRERWTNHVDPTIKRGNWTMQEDVFIMEKQSITGNRWAEISKALEGRTEHAVKNRFNSLISRGMTIEKLSGPRAEQVKKHPAVGRLNLPPANSNANAVVPFSPGAPTVVICKLEEVNVTPIKVADADRAITAEKQINPWKLLENTADKCYQPPWGGDFGEGCLMKNSENLPNANFEIIGSSNYPLVHSSTSFLGLTSSSASPGRRPVETKRDLRLTAWPTFGEDWQDYNHHTNECYSNGLLQQEAFVDSPLNSFIRSFPETVATGFPVSEESDSFWSRDGDGFLLGGSDLWSSGSVVEEQIGSHAKRRRTG